VGFRRKLESLGWKREVCRWAISWVVTRVSFSFSNPTFLSLSLSLSLSPYLDYVLDLTGDIYILSA
jgi:hypothetical protein